MNGKSGVVIALAGNPNSGKTTLFNAVTGGRERVGNWAGVTVSDKTRPLKRHYRQGKGAVYVTDLPGTYSLSAYTDEESVTHRFLREKSPDVIVQVLDAQSLQRGLYLTAQLSELGIPMVIALNKLDILRAEGTNADIKMLSHLTGCPVVGTVLQDRRGLDELMKCALTQAGKPQRAVCAPGQYADFAEKTANAVLVRGTVALRKRQDRLDAVLTSGVPGILCFAAVMLAVFQISQVWVGASIASFLTDMLDKFRVPIPGSAPLTGVIIRGVFSGVSAVVGFLPMVAVMYFLLALLEDCGYMARVSALLDPMLRKIGLSGRAVIPFVLSVGCSVPGILATRTVRDERERRTAAALAPFLPCGAKISLVSLFAGAFFDNAGWVSALMYFLGVLFIILGALLIRGLTEDRTQGSFFLIELPLYKRPSVRTAFSAMLAQSKAYLSKAATVILLCNTAVQLLQTFTWKMQAAPTPESSILAGISYPLAFLLMPITGCVSWQLAAAVLTGFVAKENVVATLALCYGAGSGGQTTLTSAALLAYLMLNLFLPPCCAAMSTMHAQMKNKKWFFGSLFLQTCVSYTAAFAVSQAGTLLTTGTFGAGLAPGTLLCISMLCMLLLFCKTYKID